MQVDDDYTLFLAETFGYPVKDTDDIGAERIDKDEEEEIANDDPDFEYRENEMNESVDEFKNNRSTKIPQKEVDALMQVTCVVKENPDHIYLSLKP